MISFASHFVVFRVTFHFMFTAFILGWYEQIVGDEECNPNNNMKVENSLEVTPTKTNRDDIMILIV